METGQTQQRKEGGRQGPQTMMADYCVLLPLASPFQPNVDLTRLLVGSCLQPISLILDHVEVLNHAWFLSAKAQFPSYEGEPVKVDRSGIVDPGNYRAIDLNGKSRVSQLTNSSSFDLTYTPFHSNGVSKIASLFLQQGQKGINQDAMVIIEDFAPIEDTIFCGVFDGHGPHGHFVSQYVRETLPQKLQSCWVSLSDSSKSSASSGDENEDYLCFAQESIDFVSGWKECFSKAYELMDMELSMNKKINCVASGTTAVSLVKLGNDLVLANVGDSRAVLGTVKEDGSLMAVQLTVDFRPDIPSEAERILHLNGRISALRQEPSVKRVWLPHHNAPGLAMSRVLGDFCLKRYGVISEPGVTHRRLTEHDKFIVLATDGVWDVLSNERVVEMVASASSRTLAGKMVVDAAMKAWERKYATSKADDCAVVCLFLDNSVVSELG